MSAFRWGESEDLAGRRPGDRAAIEKLDVFLYDRHPDDLLDAAQIAVALDLPQAQVVSLLDDYPVSVLRAEQMAQCPRCELLTPMDDVEEAEADGVACLCESGDFDLLSGPLDEVTVYRLTAEPPPPTG